MSTNAILNNIVSEELINKGINNSLEENTIIVKKEVNSLVDANPKYKNLSSLEKELRTFMKDYEIFNSTTEEGPDTNISRATRVPINTCIELSDITFDENNTPIIKLEQIEGASDLYAGLSVEIHSEETGYFLYTGLNGEKIDIAPLSNEELFELISVLLPSNLGQSKDLEERKKESESK